MPIEIDKKYSTIIISGGSIRCICALGVLQYLIKNFDIVNTYIGTSAGAIICYLLAIGYSPTEIAKYICTHKIFSEMKHINPITLIDGNGAVDYSPLKHHIEQMTINKIGKFLTLKELFDQYGKKLVCLTYDQTIDKTIELSYEYYPNLPCMIALRMTSSLPLVFSPFRYDLNKGGNDSEDKEDGEDEDDEHLFVDGSIGNHFPVDLANPSEKTLGIYIKSLKTIDNPGKRFELIKYVYNILLIPIFQASENKLKDVPDNCDVICVNAPPGHLFNFGIDTNDVLDLINEGYKTAKYFVNTKN